MTVKQRIAGAFVGAVAAVVMTGPSFAQDQCDQAVNFENADIRAVIDEIALRTGKKFVVDPRVNGQVTIKSGPNGGLCPDEAWELFQAALRVNGFTATPISASSYKIIPFQEGARAAGPVGEGQGGDFVTQIVRLKHVDAREAAANLAQIVSERGVVAPVRSGNAIILVDAAGNIERMREVLRQIDQDTTVYRTISLNHASASEVAGVVSDLAAEIAEEGGGQPTNISVVPVDASNSILIRAEPSTLNRLAGVIAELDRIGETKSDLSVIALDHADAEEMAPLLREIVDAQPYAPGEGQPAPARNSAARATVSFHGPTNSLIISGDANMQQTLRNVVRQLDVRRAQVLVEAIIVDVSDMTARELGLQYFLSGDGSDSSRVPFTATNFSSAQPNILANAGAFLLDDERFTNDDVRDAALNSLLGVNGLLLGGAGRLGDHSVFGAILTALQEDDESTVLSFPSVLTLDNQPATLSVGQEIPITTGEALSGDFSSNLFRTVERVNVGVILEVTPKINEGGTVTLDIRQETSSVAGQIISDSTDLITNKREIITTALVDDSDILVLGGLVEQMDESLESKIPLLGDIPVAGNLFKTTGRSRDRRHLMVFIRPTIIRDPAVARATTNKKLDYIRAHELLSSQQPVSELDRLIDQVTGPGHVETSE